jgi:hypothetical protein
MRSCAPTAPAPGSESTLTPGDIAAAPELALIATAEHVLELMTLALIAAHPDLVGDPPLWRPRDRHALLAKQLILARTRLDLAAARYRKATLTLVRNPRIDDDFPF